MIGYLLQRIALYLYTKLSCFPQRYQKYNVTSYIQPEIKYAENLCSNL